jgi:CAAX protease family protein
MPFSICPNTNPPDRPPLIRSGLLRVSLCLIFYLILWQVFKGISVTSFSEYMDGALGLGRRPWFSISSVLLKVLFPMFIAVVVCRLVVDRRPVSTLGLCPSSIHKTLGLGMLVAGVSVCAVFFFFVFLDVVTMEPSRLHLGLSGFALLATYHLLVAFVEELLMRGYLLANLRTSTNRYFALFISGVVFAGAHSFNLHISLIGILNLFLMGMAFALYYMAKEDLWLPIGAHWIWNVAQGPLLGYNVSGREWPSIIAHSSEGNELITGGQFGFEGSLPATLVLSLGVAAAFVLFRRESTSTRIGGQ